MNQRVWITWEIQRRNRTLSNKVGAQLYELVFPGGRLKRYPQQLAATLRVLQARRPDVLFVQNPSIVLAFFAVNLKRFFGIRQLVVDAHNAGIFPMEGRSRILNVFARYIIKHADVVIVTNEHLAGYVEDCSGRAVVIPDPLPEFADDTIEPLNATKMPRRATLICTWSEDEPYMEFIVAAGDLEGEVEFYITGNHRNRVAKESLPANVCLTGFLDEAAYVKQLQNSDFIVVLTTREHCLNCGAYEAVALEKPLLLSDTHALRAYFSIGTVFSGNDTDSLRQALRKILQELPAKQAEISQLRRELEQHWGEYMLPLENFLQ